MGYLKLSPEDAKKVFVSEQDLKIMIDTNLIFAYIDKEHDFNYEAKIIIDPLKDEDCHFFFNYIVLGEFISVWSNKKKVSINKTIDLLQKFINSFKYSFLGGKALSIQEVLDRFKRHSRHINFRKAHFNDFLILTEAETIKNLRILTCDRAMYAAGKAIFKKKIYYIPLQTNRVGSDVDRFIFEFSEFKKKKSNS